MNCKQCGGVMTIDQEKKLFICPFCGTVEPFDNVSKEELEKAINAVKTENRRMVDAIVADNRKTLMATRAESSAKDTILVIMMTVFLIICVIMTAYGFDQGYIAAGIVSSVQVGLIILGMIFKGVNKLNYNSKISLISTGSVLAAALLIVVWVVVLGNSEGKADVKSSVEKDWPTIGLGSDLPEPEKPCYDLYNSDKYMSARIKDIDTAFFNDYVKKCKEAGYDIDAVLDGTKYTAYNKNDDELVLNLFYDDELSIIMNKALNYTEFYWPKSGGAQYVPEPKADKIYVESLSDTSVRLYIADVTQSYFLQYIEELKAAGFPGSYDSKDESFYGKKDNVSVTIKFKRGRIMNFEIYCYTK